MIEKSQKSLTLWVQTLLCYIFSNRNTALAPLAQEMRGLRATFGLFGLTSSKKKLPSSLHL